MTASQNAQQLLLLQSHLPCLQNLQALQHNWSCYTRAKADQQAIHIDLGGGVRVEAGAAERPQQTHFADRAITKQA